MKRCPSCQFPNMDTDRLCFKCGSLLNPDEHLNASVSTAAPQSTEPMTFFSKTKKRSPIPKDHKRSSKNKKGTDETLADLLPPPAPLAHDPLIASLAAITEEDSVENLSDSLAAAYAEAYEETFDEVYNAEPELDVEEETYTPPSALELAYMLTDDSNDSPEDSSAFSAYDGILAYSEPEVMPSTTTTTSTTSMVPPTTIAMPNDAEIAALLQPAPAALAPSPVPVASPKSEVPTQPESSVPPIATTTPRETKPMRIVPKYKAFPYLSGWLRFLGVVQCLILIGAGVVFLLQAQTLLSLVSLVVLSVLGIGGVIMCFMFASLLQCFNDMECNQRKQNELLTHLYHKLPNL